MRMVAFNKCMAGFAAVAVMAMMVSSVSAQNALKKATDDQVAQITQAAPEKATAAPKKARKVLIFCRTEGFYHDVIPVANAALKILGEKTGAYESVISDDMAVFSADSLAEFDGVIFNNTSQLKFENEAYRKALMDFVKGGKGLIGAHAATDNFPTWPEAQKMIGGVFDGHPWGGGGTWAFKIDEPDHILNQGFQGKGFLAKDEIYQIKGAYSRDAFRVLLSLDMTYPGNLKVNGIKRTDNDFAVSWIFPYEKGRVFYCSLGHNNEIFWTPAILQHYLDGIQYALGDLDAPDAPSNSLNPKPTPARTTDAGGVADPFAGVVTYEFDQSRQALSAIEDSLRTADAAGQAQLEAGLRRVLTTEAATYAGKQFACRMLRRMDLSNETIHVLADLLSDPELSHMARYALQGQTDEEVDRILRGKLGSLEGDLLVGLIGTIGQRGDRQAISRLGSLARDTERAIAEAAIAALGRIGGSRAAQELAQAEPAEGLGALWDDAMLLCADRMMADLEFDGALSIYKSLAAPGNRTMTRVAAYRGIVRAVKEFAVPSLFEMLQDENPVIRQAGAKFINEIPGRAATVAFASKLSTLPPATQVVIVSVLAARGDRSATPYLVPLVTSEEEAVRLAALEAMGALSDDVSVVDVIDALAVEGPTAAVAKNALVQMNANGVVDAMIAGLSYDDVTIQSALLDVLTERRETDALVDIMGLMDAEDGDVRRLVYKGIGIMGTGEELPELVEALVASEDASDRNGLEAAVASILARLENKAVAVEAIVKGSESASDEAKMALVSLLSRCGGEEALKTVRRSLTSANVELRKAAVRALADWPDGSATADLAEVIEFETDRACRILALRAAPRMVALGGIDGAEALKRLEDGFGDAEIEAEIFAVYLKIATDLAKQKPDVARQAFRTVIERAGDEAVREEARKQLQAMEANAG